MVCIQLIDEVTDQVPSLCELHPEYEKQLLALAAGEWVFINDELDFILDTEVIR